MNTDIQIPPHNRELVALLLEGNSDGEIASQLGVNEGSVKKRLGDLYFELGIRDGAKRVRLIAALSDKSEKLFLPPLTPRERQVAELTLAGRTNPQISVEIGISVQQIKNYLRVIFDKCGVWSRTELAARFRCA
jgi:DNA-binding NarL/FixJ family response regulator